MPTTVRTLNYASPDAAALTPIVLPDATEQALYANAHVKNWWRADAGVDSVAKKWRCRKTDAALIPSKTNFPVKTLVTGGIASLAVGAGGGGYATPPTVVIPAPPAGGVQAEAVAVVASGVVTGFVQLVPGAGYLTAPAITLTGGGGTGATATATLEATPQYNGKPAMQFKRRGSDGVGNGGGSGALYDGGLNLLPINANFSVIIVGRQGPTDDTGYMWGNGLAQNVAGGIARGYGQGASLNSYTLSQNGSNLLNSGSGYVGKYADGPRVDVVSFDGAGDTVQQMLSPGAAWTQQLATVVSVTNGEFHLGDIGAPGTGLSAANYIEGGDVAEVMIFDVALHLAPNAALLATVRTYLGARYGIAVP